MNSLKSICILSGTVALASCGGGGSATGGLTAFSVVPTSSSIAALPGDLYCQRIGGIETLVTIVGGTPPYRLVNSNPQYIAITETTLTEKNPTFKVVTIGGCGSDLSILILDNKSRSTTFSLTVTAGEAETTTP